ncbi:MAG: hydrogen peroxide-inducible genes activator [Gammaproteobacteria bacterium]|nr:hydrogen peroxide-inducible genes activator [Gammaproteobacteria bacterium]NNF60669.1 hydrogen peroxide-inducible genes activator [Gammaproteobacteria bacterium]
MPSRSPHRLPTVKQLRYFIALAEHQHFARAAAASFVSQSAFSVAIKELENLLGVDLVDRTNKRVTITATGREIAARARACLQEIETLVDFAGGAREPLAGRLRLGVIPTIAPFLLPALLPALRASYPDLDLYLREDLTQRVYERMMDGELDLILIALPYDLRGIETMSLFQDPFLLAYRQGTKLVDPENYSFNRLPDESVLLLEDGHCLRDHALTACRLRNNEKISRFAATSLNTLIQMVDSDLGITYLPQMAMGTALLRGTRVKTLPLPAKSVYRDIGLAWRSGSRRQTEFELLGNFIREHH